MTYFSHDTNARNDEKVLMLRAEFGAEGYGIYWMLLEMMWETEDCALSFDKLPGIAIHLGTTLDKLRAIVDSCIANAIFAMLATKFASFAMQEKREKYIANKTLLSSKRAEAGKRGAQKRWSNQGVNGKAIAKDSKAIASDSKQMANDSINKIKENKINTHVVCKATHSKPDFEQIAYPPDYDTPEVRQSLKDWLTYKQDRKEPYKSAGSIKALFTQAAKSKASPEMFCWAISYAMAKNWRGIGFYPEVLETFSGVAASNGRNKEPPGVFARLLAEAQEEERLEKLGLSHGVTN